MEFSPEILNVLSGLGVGGILAIVFYQLNNKNAREYAEKSAVQAKEYADRTLEQTKIFADRIEALLNIERGRTEMLVTLVKDNTAQTSANTTVVQALHRRLDLEERQNKGESTHDS